MIRDFCLCVWLFILLYTLAICVSVCLSLCLSVCLSVIVSVCLSLCISFHLPVYLIFFSIVCVNQADTKTHYSVHRQSLTPAGTTPLHPTTYTHTHLSPRPTSNQVPLGQRERRSRRIISLFTGALLLRLQCLFHRPRCWMAGGLWPWAGP